jgi:hypothetical protein
MIKRLSIGILASIVAFSGWTQNTTSGNTDFTLQLNTITTAVPFLLIAPDSRSGAMGDVGVALSPDANSAHWNLSKLSWINNKDYVKARGGNKEEFGMSLGYSPWLKALVPDINLAYLSGYKTIGRDQAIAASLRYFSLGNITFTNDVGDVIRDFKPNEFALDVGYTRMLSERFSGGVAIRYVYSNLTGGTTTQGGGETKPGQSIAADLSGFWRSQEFDLGEKNAHVAVGFNVSNIGAKMSYTSTKIRDFIPANLRLGSALDVQLDEMNLFTVSVDFNKLLVPTPPLYQKDANGNTVVGSDGNYVIESGRDPNVGVASGIFGSFNDAPGAYYNDAGELVQTGILKEELREVNISAGLEYWYAHRFALRGGFFYEHYTKGNRQYAAFGAGMKYKTLEIDLSYLVPTSQQHPLAKTLRFTLKFNFGGGNGEEGGDAGA